MNTNSIRKAAATVAAIAAAVPLVTAANVSTGASTFVSEAVPLDTRSKTTLFQTDQNLDTRNHTTFVTKGHNLITTKFKGLVVMLM